MKWSDDGLVRFGTAAGLIAIASVCGLLWQQSRDQLLAEARPALSGDWVKLEGECAERLRITSEDSRILMAIPAPDGWHPAEPINLLSARQFRVDETLIAEVQDNLMHWRNGDQTVCHFQRSGFT